MIDITRIRERMGVIAADGRRIGFVDHPTRGGKLQVTSLSSSHGYHHLIPIAWVRQVDRYVYLSKESRFVSAHWEQAS